MPETVFLPTDEAMLSTAMAQSALELGCCAADFSRQEPVLVSAVAHPQARRYLQLPFACNLVYYGGSVVASVSQALREPVADYLRRFPAVHCFETPNLHVLDDALTPLGYRTCFMAEYFLPSAAHLQPLPCPYPTRVLEQGDFRELYLPAWSNALCAARKELDVLGVGAYHEGRLVGLAACSADCDTMWQIGIDVLPACRRQGVAAALTSQLALEILRRGKTPFYCAAWSNLPSVRNAIRSGFRPAWVELTVKECARVTALNREADRLAPPPPAAER